VVEVTAAPTTVDVQVTTGTESNAQSGQKPTVTLTGSKGSFTGTITVAGKGKSKMTTLYPPTDIGTITTVAFKASSTDGWLISKVEVDSNKRGYKSFGCLPIWLDGKPYDKSYTAAPHKDHVTLKQGACLTNTVDVQVTTGTIKNAQSGQKPTVTLTGSKGTFTGTITLAGKGKSKTTTLYPPTDIGTITTIAFKASNTDGWLMTKVLVDSNKRGYKSVSGGLPFWLDGKPYDKDSSYKSGKHGDQVRLSVSR